MKFSHREVNETSGALETWYWDQEAQKFHIKTTHDVTSVIEMNKQQAIKTLDQRFGKEMLHHVAEIPNGVIVKFKRDYGLDVFSQDPEVQKKIKRLLDDPEWRYLKTTVKKLSR